MQRRDILKRAGAATAVGLLGGCLSREGGSPGGSGADDTTTTTNGMTTTGTATTTNGTTATGTGTTTRTTTSNGNASIENRSLKVISAGCGEPKNEADIEFKDSKRQVVITGTIAGSDSCARPTLKIAKTEPKKDTFKVIVGTKKKSGKVGCSECITEIKYRATLTFEEALPQSVKVTHKSMGNSKVVAGASHEGTTASAGN
jgi:hypothetical protein